jgi:ankyrin repeat protein
MHALVEMWTRAVANEDTRELLSGIERVMKSGGHADEIASFKTSCYGTDLDASARHKGWNALHVAAFYGLGTPCKLLSGYSKEGQQPNVRLLRSNNKIHLSVLMCLSRGIQVAKGHDEQCFQDISKWIISHLSDKDLSYADKNGVTALHSFAMHGLDEAMQALLARKVDTSTGARVSDTQEDGSKVWIKRTALECAIQAHRLKASKGVPPEANSMQRIQRCIKILEQHAVPAPPA